jgi:hypothetical protein
VALLYRRGCSGGKGNYASSKGSCKAVVAWYNTNKAKFPRGTSPMPETPGLQQHPWWKPVWNLVVEVWIGSALFAVIFAPAVGLDLAVKWLQAASGASEFLIGLLTWTKYTIAILDALLYVTFMLNMAWRFLNELRWRKTNDV